MFNPYQTRKVIIKKIIQESYDVKRFVLEFKNKKDRFDFIAGQFVEVSITGFNEAPFTFGSSSLKKDDFEIAVRKVGLLTDFLHKMKVGDELGVRGPFGQGCFPMDLVKRRSLLLVSGGCGFVPLKSVIEEYVDDQKNYKGKVQIFNGAANFDETLFKKDFRRWRKAGIDINLTVDPPSSRHKGGTPADKSIEQGTINKTDKTLGLKCRVGLVTELFKKVKVVEKPIVFICGPPIMAKFVILELDKLRVLHSDIFVSLERRMECGIGVCEHCAVGPYYVCKDGPVFRWDEIEWIPNVI